MSKERVSYAEACKFDGKVLELRGYIQKGFCDVISIHDKDYSIELCDIIKDTFECDVNRHGEDLDEVEEIALSNVNLRMFFSDKRCTFEECEDKLIQVMDGDLDIRQETFGYSEFTIICFYPEKMQLGGHDILSLLESNSNKYVCMRIEKM